jgi:hypothetical protein
MSDSAELDGVMRDCLRRGKKQEPVESKIRQALKTAEPDTRGRLRLKNQQSSLRLTKCSESDSSSLFLLATTPDASTADKPEACKQADGAWFGDGDGAAEGGCTWPAGN